jgi:hypothetical protein
LNDEITCDHHDRKNAIQDQTANYSIVLIKPQTRASLEKRDSTSS